MLNLEATNTELQDKSALEIVDWGLAQAQNPIITTNFRPYESVILHLVTQRKPDIPVLWVDSGYNTSATYRFADRLISLLNLNVHAYLPQQSAAHRNVRMGGIPEVDDPLHEEFTRQVKLEPFQRALESIKPDLWFNAIRKEQTDFRQSLDILSQTRDGVLKVAPLFHWSDEQLEAYLKEHDLPNEWDYYDPTKASETRECGLHTQL